MKKIFLFLLLSQLAFSQVDAGSQTTLQTVQSLESSSSRNASPEIKAVGSPYIQKEFGPIKINKFGNTIFSAKFNAYNGEMQVETQKKLIALDVNAGYVVTFLKDKKVYKSIIYKDKNYYDQVGFLVVVKEQSSFSVYKKETISFQDKKPAKSSYEKEKSARFNRLKDEYFIKVKEEKIKYLPSRKKDLLRAYPKDAKKIKFYLKENKISLKEEEDMIKLAQFIASL